MRQKIFKKTKQKLFKKRVFSFDIETANDNKEFVLSSIVGENYTTVFYNQRDFIEELKTNPIFRNSTIFATNLSFDFFGTFFTQKERESFYTLFRGSGLLYAKTYMYKNDFTSEATSSYKNGLPSIEFLDSLNFAQLSVEKMGSIINKQKLEKPEFLGKKPKSIKEWEILEKYNVNDSQITYDFMVFLIRALEELGATVKLTLASSVMHLFKNKYLKDEFFINPTNVLIDCFSSYFGGRTEAFSRGYIEHMYYYDFNSLYPSVMHENEYPNPNSVRTTRHNSVKYIQQYDGISLVEIYCPQTMQIPILPFRHPNGRVVFGCGIMKGWYTHVELRYALQNGYQLIKIHKSHYYAEKCRPFTEFVHDLYSLRLEYKKQKNVMEYVVKICMNSLYGKFGQTFLDKENWTHKDSITDEEIEKSTLVEQHGDYFRTVKAFTEPSSFCIPIWASYTTAYGRIKLHKALMQVENPVYCDTDSLISASKLPESIGLGHLKLEMEIEKGIIVRPKFYAFVDKQQKEYVKIKGLGKRLSYFGYTDSHKIYNIGFLDVMKNPIVHYEKFAKFKEAVRRGFIPNEIIKVHKEFSLEDEKRIWDKPFNCEELQSSKPIVLNKKYLQHSKE